MRNLFLLITLLLFVSSCEKEPSAFFSVSSTKVQLGTEVEFTNQSEDGDSYSWNFDDGEKSSEENPKHTFNTAKNHQVSLTVYSKNKSKESMTTKSVKVTNYDPSNGPTYVVLEKLTITKFPLQNNGNNWDSQQDGIYPDIYFSIVDVLNNNIYLAGSENRKDDETGSPTSWTWSTQGPVLNTDIAFKINLYDFDNTTAEFMGESETILLANLDFSSNIIEVKGGDIEYSIELNWY